MPCIDLLTQDPFPGTVNQPEVEVCVLLTIEVGTAGIRGNLWSIPSGYAYLLKDDTVHRILQRYLPRGEVVNILYT